MRGTASLAAAAVLAAAAACGSRSPEPAVDLETALRSKDPAVAGPVLFAEARRAGTDPLVLLRLVTSSAAEKIRRQVERQLEAYRYDAERAARVKERLHLSKSPAEMTFDEYLREASRFAIAMGAAAEQADREVGIRYLSAALEALPGATDKDVLVVTAESVDAAGSPSQSVSVFLWENGRWGYDPEASRARQAKEPAPATDVR